MFSKASVGGGEVSRRRKAWRDVTDSNQGGGNGVDGVRLAARWMAILVAFVVASGVAAADGSSAVGVGPVASLQRLGWGGEFVPDEAVVQFKRAPTKTDLQIAAVNVEASSWQRMLLANTYVFELDQGTSVLDAVEGLAARSDVVYAEPNYIYQAAATFPNDPSFQQNWGLHNTGQSINGGPLGVADADIDAPEAWDQTRGSPNVIVAVVDTGVTYFHPDLDDNIWTNPGEVAAMTASTTTATASSTTSTATTSSTTTATRST